MQKVTTEIILGDCRDILKQISENSIDLIFTSPPYADQRQHIYEGIVLKKLISKKPPYYLHY